MYVQTGGGLIDGRSPTDICLGCHATANGAVFGYDPLAPATEYGGGNFIFLLEDNINDARNGAQQPIVGEAAGHNIVAPGTGLFADSRYGLAPGGTYPASDLGCTSCHDPHGNLNYRMLHGAGDIQGGAYTFSAPAPVAAGVDLGGGPESSTNHTAYQAGWAAWCGNCHGVGYHELGQGRFEHPAEPVLGTTIRDRYDAYLGDANPTGGIAATSYLLDVPFEDSATTNSGTSGPTASSRASCISCHRAHATSTPAAGRWDWNVDSLGEDGAVSGSYVIPNPYTDPLQRSLCVKCHDIDHDNGKSCLNCHARGQAGGVKTLDPAGN
jgi:hypothetical protein